MQRFFIAAASVLVCLVVAGPAAEAQVYAALHGGANFVQEGEFDNSAGADATLRHDPGFVAGGRLGYRLGLDEALSVDLEGEFSYRLNDIDEVTASGFADSDDGKVQSFVWMANAWLNWRLGTGGFMPYVGGGFGGVHIDIKNAQLAGVPLDNESDFLIGGQLGGGLGYQLDEHFAVSLDYRFLITEDSKFETFDGEYQSHAVMLGIKYLF